MQADRNRSLRRSVLLSWIASYALILFISNIFSILVYFGSGSVIENEINRSNLALLKQVQQVMDGQLREVERLSLQIALNPKVVELAQTRGQLSPAQKYKRLEILNDFKLYATLNGFVDAFYVYFQHERSVISADTYFNDDELFYRMTHGTENMTYQQWHDLVESYQFGDYIKLNRITEAGSTVPTIAFARSIPLTDLGEASAKIMIMFDALRFQEAIRNLQWVNRGNVLILDDRDHVIASTEPVDTAQIPLINRKVTNGSGITSAEFDGANVTMSYVSSEVVKWKYVSILPSEVFMEKAKYVRNLTVISLIVCTFIGGIAAVLFARRNYNPVRELMHLLSGKTKVSVERSRDEYDYIKDAIYSTLDERDRIHRELEQQSAILRSNFLVRLMKGRMGSVIPIDEALSTYEMQFHSDNFAVMLFYIEDFAFLFHHSSEDDEEKKLRFVHMIIQNIVEELVRERHGCYSAEMDGMIACLVSLQGSSSTSEELSELKGIVKRAKTIIQDRFHIYLTVSISGARQGIGGIAEAYQHALETLEYKMVYGANQIITYDQLRMSDRGHKYFYPLDKERQLINYIKTGDFARAKQVVDEIFDSNLGDSGLPIEMVKCLLFEMIGTIMKTIDEMHFGDQDAFVKTLNLVPRVLQSATAFAMKKEMTAILEQVCSLSANKSRGSNLKDEVLAYIAESYHDVNLSLSSIAIHFDISTSHLSRTIKEQTGESMLDAINRVRVDKAKELLDMQGLSIYETAEKVGFYNSNALIRTFKKYEGITPGQYKAKG
ncbi:helix-turn-helix domain-containing protein [Paenibacillus oryzisoli]|uniref:AraC family transcriptional regulator n=1 Tax=Paenibacillus oryzisoli TaxID=1850517 RepID=UPI003D26B417